MARLTSDKAFYDFQKAAKSALDPDAKLVTVCAGTGCAAFGATDLIEAFEDGIGQRGLSDTVAVKSTGCHGFCEKGPVVVIQPTKVFYPNVQVEDVGRIIDKTVLNDEILDDLLYIDPTTKQKVALDHELSFYAKQKRLVFRLNGLIDPTSLEDYIARDGYAALAKALFEMQPLDVVDEVEGAKLRGRGGGGFPAGRKWRICSEQPGSEKYLICNADEGDPGAFMDRSILEGTPHAVIEGMVIAAYAMGCTQGIVYVRAEYPLAVRNTRTALTQAREAGLLGKDILGTGFNFDIEIREGAGAFVCGEETALIASLEGERGMPRPRPPFPVQRGYDGKPTTINNVETLANVPLIILKGKEWYTSIGTKNSSGTKIFALAGKVNNTGLVEVPMGTTLRQIVFDIGGGIPNNRAFKAAQMGGPSGGCVPAKFLDLPIDYESVQQVGAIMGSGGLIVMDEGTCVVDIARFFIEFVQEESCGKCVPCRVGTRHMLDILTRICNGEGEEGDIERLEALAHSIKATSLCGLGQTAPNPVLSTIRYFREEYEEHIQRKHCRASVCEGIVETPCSHACPAGVNIPQYVGLISENRLSDAVHIIRRRNPFISVCGRVCNAPCERRCRRADLDDPLAIRALKRYAVENAGDVSAPLVPPATGDKEIAIVGAGPAGLSCAYFLALMGRPSVIFESLPIPGGMMTVGIPEYRLPKKSLELDIDFILSHGVELRLNTPVESVGQLLEQGYRAVFIGTGAHVGRALRVEGEDLEGVVDSLEFLRRRALDDAIIPGKTTVIIGGGNAAVDAAGSALRLGAEKVFILYRRTREEMPAYEEEIEAVLEEGVELHELVAPKRVLGKDGKVCGIEMTRMRLGDADEGGRRSPEPIEGSEYVVECDMVIPSVGQRASTDVVDDKIKLNGWGGIEMDPITGETSVPGVYTGGDCVSAGDTVIEAVGAGQRAAIAIDRAMGGGGVLPPNVGTSLFKTTEAELEKTVNRVEELALSVDERRDNFSEVLQTLSPGAACTEAGRCLRCDMERAQAMGCGQD